MKKKTEMLLQQITGYHCKYDGASFAELLSSAGADPIEMFELLFEYTYLFEKFDVCIIEHLKTCFLDFTLKDLYKLEMKFINLKECNKGEFFPILETVENFIKIYIANRKV